MNDRMKRRIEQYEDKNPQSVYQIQNREKMTDVEILHRLGGQIGTKLIGNEGYGNEVIVITGFGKESVIARLYIDKDGNFSNARENLWTLKNRDWKVL